MKKTIIFFILVFSMQFIVAQQKIEDAFSYLTWIDPEEGSEYSLKSLFGYEPSVFTRIQKRIEDLPKNDVCYAEENDMDFVLVGRYKNASMKQAVNILFSPGPSTDPTFYITDENNHLVWEFLTENVCINASGVIYTSGNLNKMFDERCKFQLKNTFVEEVKQPYLYVGIKDKLLKPVKLYSQKSGGEVVATLPAGYEIEVLLSEDYQKLGNEFEISRNYQVRTAFGLVGWLRLTDDDTYYMDPVVKGLGYYGD
ncbi:MAG: hypothetical protein GX102_07405 [Porphyromonadaceae bacterium]|nr:hypothetical protein [Porphyromonadaceae bacterium]